LAAAAPEWQEASGQTESDPSGKNESEPWEKPIPFHEHELPAFPTEAFPAWLRSFVEGLAQETQTPVDLPAMLALTNCAGAIAGRVRVRARGRWIEPVNLYTVIVMAPGNRKSAVFAEVGEPLEDAERELVENKRDVIADAASQRRVLEKKRERLEKEAAQTDDPAEQISKEGEAAAIARQLVQTKLPTLPRLICQDATPEALATLLADQDGRMCQFSPEGDLFDMIAGRYSNGSPNFDVILKSHSGDTLRVDRRGRAEHVQHPALTIGLTVQPYVIRGLADRQGFRGRGVIGRFLFSYPRSIIGHREIAPEPLSDAIREVYKDRIKHLTNIAGPEDPDGNPVPITLQLSNEASRSLQKFERELEPKLAEDGELGSMADWAGKLAGAVVRIASILSILSIKEGSEIKTVDDESTRGAIKIARYLIPHAQAIYAEMGANPQIEKAKRLTRWIQKNEKTAFTKRDAYRDHRSVFKAVTEIEPVLELLEAHEYIRAQSSPPKTKAGRKPSQVFEVNPNLLSKGQNGQNGQNNTLMREGDYDMDGNETGSVLPESPSKRVEERTW